MHQGPLCFARHHCGSSAATPIALLAAHSAAQMETGCGSTAAAEASSVAPTTQCPVVRWAPQDTRNVTVSPERASRLPNHAVAQRCGDPCWSILDCRGRERRLLQPPQGALAWRRLTAAYRRSAGWERASGRLRALRRRARRALLTAWAKCWRHALTIASRTRRSSCSTARRWSACIHAPR